MSNDLGFTFHQIGDGYLVFHKGRKAATLRGRAAAEFRAAIERLDEGGRQRLMAKVTGNYKRGSERAAKQHPRNHRG